MCCRCIQIGPRPPVLTRAGWVHIKGEKTAYTNYYKKLKESDLAQWPPKFWKFRLTTDGKAPVEVAFTDARRFGRVRLVDCSGVDIRKHSPLMENGPDPVIDTDRFTEDYLRGKMKNRHVPVKALLLDQAMISGIGNWVADETLYQAKLHPEQYSDSFSDAEIKKLYEAIRYVCQTAVDKLGDSDEFPEHWLFNYRWGKGDKDAATQLPNGVKLSFITVGGRTSCFAPGVQKKTGKVVPGAKAEPVKVEEEKEKEGTTVKKSRKQKTESKGAADLDQPPTKKKRMVKVRKEEEEEYNKQDIQPDADLSSDRRRSARLQR